MTFTRALLLFVACTCHTRTVASDDPVLDTSGSSQQRSDEGTSLEANDAVNRALLRRLSENATGPQEPRSVSEVSDQRNSSRQDGSHGRSDDTGRNLVGWRGGSDDGGWHGGSDDRGWHGGSDDRGWRGGSDDSGHHGSHGRSDDTGRNPYRHRGRSHLDGQHSRSEVTFEAHRIRHRGRNHVDSNDNERHGGRTGGKQ